MRDINDKRTEAIHAADTEFAETVARAITEASARRAELRAPAQRITPRRARTYWLIKMTAMSSRCVNSLKVSSIVRVAVSARARVVASQREHADQRPPRATDGAGGERT